MSIVAPAILVNAASSAPCSPPSATDSNKSGAASAPTLKASDAAVRARKPADCCRGVEKRPLLRADSPATAAGEGVDVELDGAGVAADVLDVASLSGRLSTDC